MLKSFYKILFVFFLAIWFVPDANATHIVGGDMTYRHIGDHNYEITLTIRRDCEFGNPEADFDDPASVGVFDGYGNLLHWFGIGGQLLIPLNTNDTLMTTITSDCGFEGTEVCVQQAIYRDTVCLPFRESGYYLAYQRCCRNSSLSNILDPLNTGSTYYVRVREEALQGAQNSSPVFNQWPDLYVCANEPLVFDHSATDVDGDSLVYSLCTPHSGATMDQPMPQPPPPPPYDFVQFAPPYSESDMMGGVPLTIDSETGELNATPNLVGQFLIGICVREYRDGKLLSTTIRDFEYNVRVCTEGPVADFEPSDVQCDGLTVEFTNTSEGGDSFLWCFDSDDPDGATSEEFSPTHTFTEPGFYNVKLEVTRASDGCTTTIIKEIGVFNSELTADFNYSITSCDADTITLTLTDNSVDPDTLYDPESYEWIVNGMDTLIGNPVMTDVIATENTTISLLVTSSNGCTATIEQTITPEDLIITPTFTYELQDCSEDSLSVLFTNTSELAGAMVVSQEWNINGTIYTENPIMVMVPREGPNTATLTVEFDNGCSGTTTEDLVFDIPMIEFADDNPTVCLGDTIALVSNPNPDYTYVWEPTDGLIFEDPNDLSNPLASPDDTITYTVTVSDSICFSVAEITVNVEQKGTPEIVGDTISCDGMFNLMGTNGGTGAVFEWGINNNFDPVLFEGDVFNAEITGDDITLFIRVQEGTGCAEGYDSITVINAELDLDYLTTIELCDGDTLDYSVVNNNPNQMVEISWEPSDNIIGDLDSFDIQIVSNDEESFTLYFTVSNELGCEINDSVQVMVFSPPNLDFSYELQCGTYEVCFTNLTTPAMESIIWIFGDPTTDSDTSSLDEVCYTYPGAGTYEVNLIGNMAPCAGNDTLTMIIEVPEIFEITSPDEEIVYCAGDTVTLSASANVEGVSISWCNMAGDSIGSGPSIDIVPEGDQMIFAKGMDAAGCTDTFKIQLFEYGFDVDVIVPELICANTDTTLTVIDNAGDNLSYNWAPEDCISAGQGTNEVTISAEATKDFMVTITNNDNGCDTVITMEVVVSDVFVEISKVLPEEPTESEIYRGAEAELEANPNMSDWTYEWSTGDNTQTITVEPDSTTTYVVTVTDENGCTATDEFELGVRQPNCDETDIFLPNAFSPDGNNVNDVLYVRSNFIETMELRIYNRWGQEVFFSNDQSIGWDGTFNGEQLPPDAYAFSLMVTCTNLEDYIASGNVQLFR